MNQVLQTCKSLISKTSRSQLMYNTSMHTKEDTNLSIEYSI
jgi:hypothetical protein